MSSYWNFVDVLEIDTELLIDVVGLNLLLDGDDDSMNVAFSPFCTVLITYTEYSVTVCSAHS